VYGELPQSLPLTRLNRIVDFIEKPLRAFKRKRRNNKRAVFCTSLFDNREEFCFSISNVFVYAVAIHAFHNKVVVLLGNIRRTKKRLRLIADIA